MAVHREDSFDEVASIKHVSGPAFFFVSDAATTQDFPPPPRPVLEFDADENMNAALRELAMAQVLSAPVWDSKANRYLGFVDVFDLATLAVGVDIISHLIPGNLLLHHKKQRNEEIKLRTIFTKEPGEKDDTFCKWTPVYEGEKLKTVLALLASETRRVPILSKTTGRVVNIISQSAVVHELYERIRSEGIVLSDTPLSSGIGLKKVCTVTTEDTARTAFQAMVENRISAVGIVDPESGELITALSSKDIRLLPHVESAGLESRNPFDLSSREFVSLIRRVTETDGKAHAACVVVGEDQPLSLVIGKLAATKMHRVFVVDKQKKPVGVISVSDVIFALQQIQPQSSSGTSSSSSSTAAASPPQ